MLALLLTIVTLSAATCEDLIKSNENIVSVEEAFSCIDSIEMDSDWKKTLLDNMKRLFELYIYKDIVKNPPQPEGRDNYYVSVDIDERLNALSAST